MMNLDQGQRKTLAVAATLTADILGLTGIGIGITYWGSQHWGWPDWSVIVGGTLGLVIAIVRLVRAVVK